MNKDTDNTFSIFIALIIAFALSVLFFINSTFSKGIRFALAGFCFIISFFIILEFAYHLYYVLKKTTKISICIITAIIFLFLPITNTVVNKVKESNYVKAYPNDNIIYAQITCDVEITGRSGSIGSEWKFTHLINGKEFKNEEVVEINAKEDFRITSRIKEYDSSYSDVGESTSSKFNYSTNDNYKKELTISQNVHVAEKGGKQNKGASADFKVTYRLKRVLPSSMNYFDRLLYNESSLGIILIVLRSLSVITIVAVIVRGIIKKHTIEKEEELDRERFSKAKEEELQRLREEDRIRREEEYNKGREAFINRLDGRTIKEVAGVPSSVEFIDNLPRDNNNSTYGSFTVYYSKNGKCYHERAGCCSARSPIHSFLVIGKYKPCSKCFPQYTTIPQWYTDYIRLKKEAEYYGIHSSTLYL